MLDAYIIDWIKKEQEKRRQEEDKNRPRIWQEVPLPLVPPRRDYRSEIDEDNGRINEDKDEPENIEYKIEISLVKSYFR